jgi:hypothetical protein
MLHQRRTDAGCRFSGGSASRMMAGFRGTPHKARALFLEGDCNAKAYRLPVFMIDRFLAARFWFSKATPNAVLFAHGCFWHGTWENPPYCSLFKWPLNPG